LGADLTIGGCLANSCLDKCHKSDEQDFTETGIFGARGLVEDKVFTAKPIPKTSEVRTSSPWAAVGPDGAHLAEGDLFGLQVEGKAERKRKAQFKAFCAAQEQQTASDDGSARLTGEPT